MKYFPLTSSGWNEYATNGGDITSWMMTNAILWKHTGGLVEPGMIDTVIEVCKTLKDSEEWVKLFESRHLAKLQWIAKSPRNYKYENSTHKILTMSTCARFLVSIYQKKSPGAWVTLIGEDPPEGLRLQGLAANRRELEELLSLELDPNKWVIAESVGIG